MKPPPADPRVVHRDDDFLVLDKPPGLPTTHPEGGDCLVARAHLLDPEAPRLHPSSRLDAEVSGLVTFARTRAATLHLMRARSEGTYLRTYVGLVAAPPSPSTGTWCGAIAIDPSDPRRRCVDVRRGKRARTHYETAATTDQATALHLHPQTGRTHQLRVHAAEAGAPLLGDRHYGGAIRVTLPNGRVLAARRVLLHCALVSVPSRGNAPHVWRAAAHEDLAALWQATGGNPGALWPVELISKEPPD